ncbi:hypothetical protein MAR_002235 [Mya arenaria]|uniref:Integrase core domain-containing protein n=1 Tax=Mya arenaria TaxID=6604 RepID=A0ABY7FH86_MYAAR|nr:hypothetical protein MAR_002235 [Mya arenaria]
MEEQGIFSTADAIHIRCVRFCFMQLIQQELDLVRTEWNAHYIRRQTREGTPCGKPDIYDYIALVIEILTTNFQLMGRLRVPGCLLRRSI